MPSYNSVHRQQLFNWIGRHIEKEAAGRHLTDELRIKYVECLRGTLENGLWVKTPEKPDSLWDGSLFTVDRPITCFTEWALDQSQPHTREYGRMALGFPKRFVLNCGGQPIMYIRDGKQKAPYAFALRAVAEWLGDQSHQPSNLDCRAVYEQFRYLIHFNKRIKHAKKRASGKKGKSTATPKVVHKPDLFKKSFGPILHYLEEREWRVVYDRSIAGCFRPAGGGDRDPKYYLPFKPGKDLFTVVLPDNRTVRFAMEDSAIRQALFPDKAPPVTVLSLDDIGTF